MTDSILKAFIYFINPPPTDQLHSVPIAQMGNYQDFLKAAPQPLRDADPEQPKRLHTFGNPFKLDKKVTDSDQFLFLFFLFHSRLV